MKFRIDGKMYDAADLSEMTLKDVLTVERETEELGHRLSFGDLVAAGTRMAGMTKQERAEEPMAMWVFAVSIWVSRRRSGEQLSLGDAIDLPLSKIEVIAGPEDRQSSANPRKAPKGAKRPAPRKVSAPVAALPAAQ